MVDARCPVCNKTFSSRALALDHLAYRSTGCAAAAAEGVIPVPNPCLSSQADITDRAMVKASGEGKLAWAAIRGFTVGRRQ